MMNSEAFLVKEEKEERKVMLTRAVVDAVDAGHYFIVIVSYAGRRETKLISEFCSPEQKMETLSNLNKEMLPYILGGASHDCKECSKKDTCELPQRKRWEASR